MKTKEDIYKRTEKGNDLLEIINLFDKKSKINIYPPSKSIIEGRIITKVLEFNEKWKEHPIDIMREAWFLK